MFSAGSASLNTRQSVKGQERELTHKVVVFLALGGLIGLLELRVVEGAHLVHTTGENDIFTLILAGFVRGLLLDWLLFLSFRHIINNNKQTRPDFL